MKTTNITLLFSMFAISVFSQIPILNSYPSITNKVVYLDFDGQVVSGTAWNSGNTVNALASAASATQIRTIWQRVSEDYRPFDVNITTDSVRFNNAPPNRRMRVVFTPSNAWYTVPNGGAGGVAFLGSFTWGGTPGTPCWIFENQLGNSTKNMAEAASHEVGHTLSLRHQSIYNAQCTKTDEYNPGQGSGVTGWAPIMGVGYSKNVTIWHNGKSASGCNVFQLDHSSNSAGITGASYLSFLPDDVGNTYNGGKILNLNSVNLADSGLISTPTDVDAYVFTICNSRYVSVNVKPWALDTNNASGNSTGFAGANLDVKLKLFNASNNLLVADSSTSRLKALVGMTLPAGSYYFTVDGDGSPNYTDYGSLGKYYISVKATNPPSLANSIVTATNICAGQSTTLSSTSNGTPTTWQWNITGPTSATFNTQSPSLVFNSLGVYTIELLAYNTSSPSCVTTKTIQVASLPNLVLSNANATVCPGKTTSLSVSGASSYTWMPGNFGGATQIVSPAVNTTYTVLASNAACNTSTVYPVSVRPDYTLSFVASATNVCAGTSVTLTASGASNYNFFPAIPANPAVVNPTFNTTYTVNGTDGFCTKTKVLTVNVSQPYAIDVTTSDTSICQGQSALITSSGAQNYIVYPGNLSGNPITVTPSVGTTYTIVGAVNNNICLADTTVFINAKNCTDTGLEETQGGEDVLVYPNPFSGSFTIDTPSSVQDILVYNALGSLVYACDKKAGKTTVLTKDWTKGVYLVKIRTTGGATLVKKIVLE